MRPLFGLAALCAIVAVIVDAMFIYMPIQLNLIGLIIATFFIMKLAWDDFNFKSVATVICSALILEQIIIAIYSALYQASFGHFISNNVFFSTHLFFDVLILLFIGNRRAFMMLLYSKHSKYHPEILKKAIVDAPLYGVFLLFCIVDSLALVENLLRNLERIGVSEEIAKDYWSWTFMFDNYELFKAALLGLMFMTLFACAYIANKQSKRMEAQGAV